MTAVLITTDTELSFMLHRSGFDPLENLRVAVMGEVSDGTWGIGYQMQRLDAHGLKGVFFVEALSSRVFGLDILKRIVEPILTAGHDVQLHLHTEWLKWIDEDIVGDRRGSNIKDFAYDDQRRLLDVAIEALAARRRAEARRLPRRQLRRQQRHAESAGDRSASTMTRATTSPMSAPPAPSRRTQPLTAPVQLDGLIEVPITYFEDYPGHTRALQVCAASAAECQAIVRQAIDQDRPTIVVVSHSFELLNVKRTRANRLLLKRFDDYCALMQDRAAELHSVTFRDLSPRR